MNRFRQVLLYLLIIHTLQWSSVVVPLPGHTRPTYLAVDSQRLVISDFPGVFIYAKKNFKLLKKFGTKGEGPQEFQGYANLTLTEDMIVINSIGKISFFKKDGEFIKERKLGLVGAAFKPAGNHYGTYGFVQEKKVLCRTINLFNSHFKKTKELYRYRHYIQGQGPLRGAYVVDFVRFGMMVYRDKVIFTDMEEFIVYIWDEKEDRVTAVRQKYKKIPFTNSDEKRYDRFFKTDPTVKRNYQTFKPIMKFPDYFPPIKGFSVGNGKIFIFTFKTRKGMTEFYIYDLEGKLFKKSFLPLRGDIAFYTNPFAFFNNKMYQLVENEEDDQWEIHVTNITGL